MWPDLEPTPRRHLYPLVGAVLSFGAPGGLLLLRRIAGHVESLHAELAGHPATYLYVALSTLVVFIGFGWVIGRQADRLFELSMSDALTGLRNTRYFHDRLEDELARARRYQLPLAVVVLDLDGLKAINDRHGHRAGDAALRRIAHAVRSACRETDTAARIGGDEFGLLAPSTDLAAGLRLAERIRQLVESAPEEPPLPAITVSAGVAELRDAEPPMTGERLVADADAALYVAKSAGRNRVFPSPPARA